MVNLETSNPSDARSRQALATLARLQEKDLTSAQLAALIAGAHPALFGADERAHDWGTLCLTHGFGAGCVAGAWDIAAERPSEAQMLWEEGCKQGFTEACPPAVPTGGKPVELPDTFVKALATVGATFRMPPGFHVVPSPDNPHFETELAILSDDGRLEVRYGIRDDSEVLSMIDECKGQPGCISAGFAQVERSQPYVTLANVGQIPPDQVELGPFPALPVRIEFNAMWGMTGAVQADEKFAPDGPVTSLAFLHRDPAANLYVFFLFHDFSATQDLQPRAFHALRFTEPAGLSGIWGAFRSSSRTPADAGVPALRA